MKRKWDGIVVEGDEASEEMYDDDEDDEDDNDAEIVRANKYFEECAFRQYPQYKGCDVKKLIKRGEVLVSMQVNPYGMDSSYNIVLNAYVPDPQMSGSYKNFSALYTFRQKLNVTQVGSAGGEMMPWREWLIEKLKNDPYYLVLADGFLNTYSLDQDFKWELDGCWQQEGKSVKFGKRICQSL